MISNFNNNRYAVVDNFSAKVIDLDGDGKGDMSHGDITAFFLKASNPDAKIDRYNVADGNGDISQQNVYQALNQISQKGNYYNGVNMSLSVEVPYQSSLTPENLNDNRELVKNDLNGSIFGSIINMLENITSQNVPVYTSAGNDPNIFDLYSFANGVTSVGTTYLNGTDKNGYSNNSLVDMYFNGNFTPNPIMDKNGNLKGIDIDNDGKIDVTANELSALGKSFQKSAIAGKAYSSIATPKALGTMTKGKGNVTTNEEMAKPPSAKINTGVVTNEDMKKTPADAVIKKAPAPKPEPKQVRNNDLDGAKGDKLDSTAKKFNDDLDNFDID